MNVITATHSSQGARNGDFDWAIEGELIMFGVICARDEADPDGGCGCGRAFSGLSSHRATTTAVIRDLPLSRTDVEQALAGYYEAGGWAASRRPRSPTRWTICSTWPHDGRPARCSSAGWISCGHERSSAVAGGQPRPRRSEIRNGRSSPVANPSTMQGSSSTIR